MTLMLMMMAMMVNCGDNKLLNSVKQRRNTDQINTNNNKNTKPKKYTQNSEGQRKKDPRKETTATISEEKEFREIHIVTNKEEAVNVTEQQQQQQLNCQAIN